MDGEDAKMLVLDIQKEFPEEFEEILAVRGYANLIRMLQIPQTRLAAIKILHMMPHISDGDVLVDIGNNHPDEVTRTAAREAMARRSKLLRGD